MAEKQQNSLKKLYQCIPFINLDFTGFLKKKKIVKVCVSYFTFDFISINSILRWLNFNERVLICLSAVP